MVWVKVINPGSPWTKVSLDGIADGDDLKKAIKAKMSPELGDYPALRLAIAATKGNKNKTQAVELDEEDDLASILRRFGVEGSPLNSGYCRTGDPIVRPCSTW